MFGRNYSRTCCDFSFVWQSFRAKGWGYYGVLMGIPCTLFLWLDIHVYPWFLGNGNIEVLPLPCIDAGCWNMLKQFLHVSVVFWWGIQSSCAICRHPLPRQPGLVLPPGKDRKPWNGGKNLKQEAGDQTEAGELGSTCIPNNGQQMAAVWTAILGGVFQGNWQQRRRGVHKKPSRHGLELPWIHFSQERLKGTVARFTFLTVETMSAIKCGARTDRSKMPWHWLATGLGYETSLGDGLSLAFLFFFKFAC